MKPLAWQVTLAITGASLIGCQANSVNTDAAQTELTPMNQPRNEISLIDDVNSAQNEVHSRTAKSNSASLPKETQASIAIQAKNKADIQTVPGLAISKKEPSAFSASDLKEDPLTLVSQVAPKKKIAIKPVSKSSQLSSANSPKSAFYLYEGENYKSVISRWLNKANFETVTFLVNDRSDRALNRFVSKNEVVYSSLENAIEQAFDTAITLDEKIKKAQLDAPDTVLDSGIEVSDFVDSESARKEKEAESKPIELRLDLDKAKSQAVITSSKMPVVVFKAEKGSLKKNYLRLAKFYDWKAKEEFYLATDYQVTFGFPITTEAGNIQPALEALLTPYYNLRAVTVPTTREVYILQEKE